MFINKNNNGCVIVTDIIKNQYIKQVYYGYNLKQCKTKFNQYVKNLTK